MDTVTYPQPDVIEFIEQHVVPARAPNDQSLSADFGVTWTPTIIMLDQSGKEHLRTVGFLDPEELKSSVLMGKAKICFDGGKFDDAIIILGKLIEGLPRSSFAPEAIFLRGVSQYKSTHNPQPLKEAYQQLTEHFPESGWTKRAIPYRLL